MTRNEKRDLARVRVLLTEAVELLEKHECGIWTHDVQKVERRIFLALSEESESEVRT